MVTDHTFDGKRSHSELLVLVSSGDCSAPCKTVAPESRSLSDELKARQTVVTNRRGQVRL